MITSYSMPKTDGTILQNITQYRTIIGALQYFTLTRLKIIFLVNKHYQFLYQPTDTF